MPYPSPEIAAGMDRLTSHIQSVVDAYWQKMGFTHSMPPIVEVESIGASYAKVIQRDRTKEGIVEEGARVYCFVAMKDSNTKGMGAVKEGDIFKAASWKAPAKHSRGNIFTDLSRCNPWGMEYLK